MQRIFAEPQRDMPIDKRLKLKEYLKFIREGDRFTFTRVDRVYGNSLDLQLLVKDLSDRGITLTATEHPNLTKNVTSKCLLEMLGVFAELEINLR